MTEPRSTPDYGTIRDESIGSAKWSLAGTLLQRIVPPLATLLLARLLDPAAFGTITVALVVVALADVLREEGLSKAFVHLGIDKPGRRFATAFWLSIASGSVLAAAVALLAPWVAAFFNDEAATPVVRVLALQILVSSFATVHTAVLLRRLDFRRLFHASLWPALAPLLVSMPLALSGFGVWALVGGYLAGSLLRVLSLWWSLPWRPALAFERTLARDVARFGALVSLEALLGWVFVWGDKAVVGHFLEPRELGLYAVATSLVTGVFALVLGPVSQISYPVLCRLESQGERFRFVAGRLLRLSAFLASLAGLSIAAFSAFAPLLLGAAWRGIELPLLILAASAVLSWTVTIVFPDAFRALGRPGVMPVMQTLKLGYTLPLWLAGISAAGLIGFCYARLGTVFVGFVVFALVGVSIVGMRLRELAGQLSSPFVAVAATAAVLGVAHTGAGVPSGAMGWAWAAALQLIVVAAYLGTLVLIDRDLLRSVFTLVRDSLRNQRLEAYADD